MKTILVLSFLVAGMLQAQVPYKNLKDNGVYLSDIDYMKGNLTYAFNKDEGFKFKENRILPITIKTSDTIYKLYQDEVWGYRKKGLIGGYSMKNFIELITLEKFAFILYPAVRPAQYHHQRFISAAISVHPFINLQKRT